MTYRRSMGQWAGAAALLGGLVLLAGCSESVKMGVGAEAARGGGEVRFTDVTEIAGLGAFRHDNGGFGQKWMPEIVGAGGAFVDYDGDGWQDVALVGGGRWPGTGGTPVPALSLYRNNGDGTFTLKNAEVGIDRLFAYAFGVSAADYDNDGDQDLFVTTLHKNLLLRNDPVPGGGRVFVEVGAAAGLADEARWSLSALFFDADRDGWLDLFVTNYVHWTPEIDVYCPFEGVKGYCTPQSYEGVSNSFYRNNGDGTFSRRTKEAGILAGIEPARDKSMGVVELDYDNDGWSDLFIGNDTERDLLYHNNGDGTFTEVGVRSGVAYDHNGKPRAGMGVDAGVVDSSGQATIFVGNFSQEMVGIYRSLGNGIFLDRAAASRVGHPSLRTLTFGMVLLDVDLDTDLDLLLANGHVQEHIERIIEGVTFKQQAQLFLNQGDGSFEELKRDRGVFTELMVGRGAAYADYDRDGDLDVLLTENNGPAHLWRNDLDGGRFLRLFVRGRRSNPDGLGTRVVAHLGGLSMERRIRTGSSYLSQSEKVATFGLGGARGVDSLVVYWPSGQVERFGGVEGNRELLLVEGSGVLQPLDTMRSLLTAEDVE